MVRKAATDHPSAIGANFHAPILSAVAHPLELDTILARECDIAFCIRLAQARYRERPCIVRITDASDDWKESAIFKRNTGLVIVNDQALINRNRIYFISAHHNIERQGTLLWIKKPGKPARDFIAQLHTLTVSSHVNIGDLVVLKGTQAESLLDYFDRSVTAIWYEGDPDQAPADNAIRTLSRQDILDNLCRKNQTAAVSEPTGGDNGGEACGESARIEENLLAYLHHYGQIDYSHFRQTWLAHHVRQRCESLGLSSTVDYMSYCYQNPGECKTLEQQLLPRQPQPVLFAQTFKALQRLFRHAALTPLIDKTPTLRMWTPNCAIGESAYASSLAWQHGGINKPIKLFATDISRERIEIAAAGLHPDCFAAVSNSENQEATGDGQHSPLQSLPFLRKQITFVQQDLLSLPSFSHLHLIHYQGPLSLYKQADQLHILSIFYTSLTDNGFLYLQDGELSDHQALGFETVADFPGLFRKIPSRARHNDNGREKSAKILDRRFYAPPLPQLLDHHKRRNRYREYHGALDRLIDKHLAPGLLIDELGRLIHTLGNVGTYIEAGSEGNYATHVKKILKPELVHKLSPAIDRLLIQGRELRMTIPWKSGKDKKQLRVFLDYIHGNEPDTGFGAILFEEFIPNSEPENVANYSQVEPHLRYIEKLENDLSESREQESERVLELEEEIRALNKVVAEIAATNEQLSKHNHTLSDALELQQRGYNLCRLALGKSNLSGEATDKQEDNPAIAIVDQELCLVYFNRAMGRYFIGSDIEIGDNFQSMAELIGGEAFIAAIKTSLAEGGIQELKLPGLITVQAVPLPRKELMIHLVETRLPKNKHNDGKKT